MSKTTGVTRRKLYEMVWREPVEDVAAKFGLSGRGLAKLCERHSIPVPPRGYWQKRTAGKAGAKPPLLITEGDETIFSLWRRGPKPAATQAEGTEPSDPPVDPFFALYTAQLASCDRISKPKKTAAPHPVVAAWQQRERRTTEDDWAFRRQFDFAAKREATTSLQKRMWFLQDALFHHLTGQGFTIENRRYGMNAACAALRTVSVNFELSERIKQYRRPLTPEERAESMYASQKFRQIREPTGELVFDIKSPMPRTVPSRWQDEPDRPLESRLHEVAAGFAVAVAYRRKLDEDERRIAEARREAEEAAWHSRREREVEAERRQRVLKQAANWEEAQRLRAFVVAVGIATEEGRAPALHLPLSEWREWAEKVADELDPLRPRRS